MNFKQKELSRCLVLIEVLSQEIDNVSEKPLGQTVVLREQLDKTQSILLAFIDEVYEKSNIGQTSFFSELQQKLNYQLDRLEQKYFKKK